MLRNHNGLRATVTHSDCKLQERKARRAAGSHRDYIQDTLASPCYFSCFSITSEIRASIGNSTQKIEPSPSIPVLSAHRRPPCISTKRRLIGKPRPVPPALRVVEESTWVNSWNTASSLSGGMPMPESLTVINTRAPSIGFAQSL